METVAGVAEVYQSMMASSYAAHFRALARSLSEIAVGLRNDRQRRPTLKPKPKIENEVYPFLISLGATVYCCDLKKESRRRAMVVTDKGEQTLAAH